MYYGGDPHGQPRELGSRDEFFAMSTGAMTLNDEFSNELSMPSPPRQAAHAACVVRH